jgi:threonine/homoserine/homoserine lactone efflux protein
MGAAFLKSLLFGVVLAGSIGPIALVIFGTAARRGFMAGAFAGLGAALADLLYALAAFSAGALLLPPLAAHERAIRIGSALLLVTLALAMLLRRQGAAAADSAPAATASLWPTFLLTLVNPMTIVVSAGFVPQLPVAGSPLVAAWLASALFLGSLAVQIAISAAGAAAGAALPGPGWQRAINAASAIGILAFGIAGLAGA